MAIFSSVQITRTIQALQKILSSECFNTHPVIRDTLVCIVLLCSVIYVLFLLIVLLVVGKLLLKVTALKDLWQLKGLMLFRKISWFQFR